MSGETQGNLKFCGKKPGKLRENSRNLVSQKCGHPGEVRIKSHFLKLVTEPHYLTTLVSER